MTDETPKPTPVEPSSPPNAKTRRTRRRDLGDAAERLNVDLSRFAESPKATALSESMKRLTADFDRFKNSPIAKELSESMERLNSLSIRTPQNQIRIPAISPEILRIPDRPEVVILRGLHAELEGLARLLEEGAQQTAAMAEVTRANLAAVQAVVMELQQSRESSDRSNRALFWLTVAIFAATAVGAVALLPEFVRQVAAGLSWLQSLR